MRRSTFWRFADAKARYLDSLDRELLAWYAESMTTRGKVLIGLVAVVLIGVGIALLHNAGVQALPAVTYFMALSLFVGFIAARLLKMFRGGK